MTRKWKRIRSRWAEFISPVRLGCRPSKERVGLAANFPPYSPVARHDFILLLVDDTVISGSYNFSRSAQYNAENILLIGSEAPADRYSFYIDHLMEKYGRVANK